MCPGFDSRTRRHMWVEFVVGSLLCSKRFFSGYSSFPLSPKTNISKFQFDLDYCQALYHEPLARVIAQALPAFDVKFTFTLHYVISKTKSVNRIVFCLFGKSRSLPFCVASFKNLCVGIFWARTSLNYIIHNM